MRIGVPKEIKTQEFRVGMTPSGVAILHDDLSATRFAVEFNHAASFSLNARQPTYIGIAQNDDHK